MGKRKRSNKEDSDLVENLLRKVKKLVKKRRRIESSSSDDEPMMTTQSSPLIEEQPELVSDLENTNEIPVNEAPLELEEAVNDNNCQDLEPDLLELLGTDPTQEKRFGDNLQKDIAIRWKHILLNGLSKDEKSDLLKRYLPAENCTYMKAPKLNPEMKTALSEINLKKDFYSEQKQNQMASCIAAIGKGLNLALSRTENVPQEIIKTLSDAGRLLCDTHYRESVTRRYTITNSISKQKKEVIRNTKFDEYLFGTDLYEHLKSSRAISKSALELKATFGRARYQQQPLAQPSTSGLRRPEALNARGAPRAAATEQRVNPPPHARRQVPPLPLAPPPTAPPPPPPPLPRDRYRGPNRARNNRGQQNWKR